MSFFLDLKPTPGYSQILQQALGTQGLATLNAVTYYKGGDIDPVARMQQRQADYVAGTQGLLNRDAVLVAELNQTYAQDKVSELVTQVPVDYTDVIDGQNRDDFKKGKRGTQTITTPEYPGEVTPPDPPSGDDSGGDNFRGGKGTKTQTTTTTTETTTQAATPGEITVNVQLPEGYGSQDTSGSNGTFGNMSFFLIWMIMQQLMNANRVSDDDDKDDDEYDGSNRKWIYA